MERMILLVAMVWLWSAGYAQENEASENWFKPEQAEARLEGTQEILTEEAFDLSGHWSGTRYQYNTEQNAVVKTFEYRFDLQQMGNLISGSSRISTPSGEFAEILLKGMIVGNKLHFWEYELADDLSPQHIIWCFKIGELELSEDAGTELLHGPTNSYTADDYMPCSGGFTILERNKQMMDPMLIDLEKKRLSSVEEGPDPFDVSAYPNPFRDEVHIAFSLEGSEHVRMEVYDMTGRLVTRVLNEALDPGDHKIPFSGRDFGYNAGAFVIQLSIGEKVYSRQVIQMQ